jgi:WD40 repeat protein
MTNITVDGYQVYEEIGRGGSGVVYRALELDTEREVAIKVIEQGPTNDPEFIRRFQTEAQFVAQLEHPHIVPLYNYRREPGRVCLVMRYLREHSLRDWLLRRGPLNLARASQMLDQISLALAYAHKREIVHRDLKPGNILLDEEGNFYLTDFGIAIHVRGVEIGGIGTPDYTAPEQWRGQPATPQSDIYSLGITFYETLTGQNPFHTATPGKLMDRHSREPVPPLGQVVPSLPEALDRVIQRATAKDENDRYTDAVSMALDLHRALASAEHPGASAQTTSASLSLADPHAATPLMENPYKGLNAFKETDAIDFFGRESFTAQLVTRLGQRADAHRFLALVGASGSGKSSVVYAGLFPALRRNTLPGARTWFLAAMTPGANPFEELESTLREVAIKATTELVEQMRRDERGLLEAIEKILPDDGSELLLFIDQFEEIFTLVADEGARTRFLDNLVTAVRDPHSRFRLIIALRADFYDRPLLYPLLADLIRERTEVLVPLTREEIREAIVRPAQRVNLTFDAGLAEAIIADVGNQPGSLPLLQYTLAELYKRRSGNHLTLELYRASGSLSGVLTHRADEIYSQLSPVQREIARQLFLRLVIFGAGVEATRQRVKRSELSALVLKSEKSAAPDKSQINVVLDHFNQHRLLTFDYDPATRTPTVEIAHEILIRAWERLADWLNASRDDLRVHRQLIAAVREWTNAGRDPSYLATGSRLSRLEALATEADLAFNDEERAYLDSSIAERRRQETEREKLRRRLLRSQRAIIAILAIFLLVSAGLSVFALSNRSEALTAADVAFARQLAAQAVTELQKPIGNDEFAALLAIRSLNLRYDPIADQALVEAAGKLPVRMFSGHSDEVYAVAFSPDSKYVLTGSADHTAKLWDIATGREVRAFIGHSLDIWSVAFSPDGKYVLTGSADKTAKLWETATGLEVRALIGHGDEIRSVAYSPDGKYVLTGSPDDTAKLWETATGLNIHTFVAVGIESVAFSPDGKYMLTGSGDYTARLWNLATRQELLTFAGHTNSVASVAFSPDGKSILTGSLDNTAKLWDVATGQEIRTFRGHSNSVRSVAFSPDGQYVLTGSGDNTARLWDVATGQEIRAFRGHSARLYSVAFSPDGKYVLTGSSDRTAKLWDVAIDGQARILRGHRSEIRGVAFSPDGRYVLTGSLDKTAKIWSATGQELRTLRGHTDEVWSVAFSPDGQSVLTGSADHTAKVWNATTGQEIRTFSGHSGGIFGVAFSPDGKYVLTGSADHTAKLWNATTGQEIHTFSGHSDLVESAAFSPDGRFVLTGSEDGTAKLWDAHAGQEIRTFVGQIGTNYGVAFSPDGRFALMGGENGTAKLWDVSAGQEVRAFVGHSHSIYGVAFSPGGQYILTASADRTARLWDVTTGQSVRTLSGHRDAIWSVAFSRDGKYVLTGSLDYTAKIWETDYRDFIATTCARLLRDFTDEEREQVPIPDKEPACPRFSK